METAVDMETAAANPTFAVLKKSWNSVENVKTSRMGFWDVDALYLLTHVTNLLPVGLTSL